MVGIIEWELLPGWCGREVFPPNPGALNIAALLEP